MNKPSISIDFTVRRNHPFPLVGSIIRLVEGTSFSHVAVRITTADNRSFVYHSTFTGVNFLNSALYEKKYKVVQSHKFDIDKQEQKKLITFFISVAGNSYPLKEIVGVIAVRLADRLFGKKIDNPFGSNKMFCSEVALKVLKLLDYQLPATESKINALIEIEQILKAKDQLRKD